MLLVTRPQASLPPRPPTPQACLGRGLASWCLAPPLPWTLEGLQRHPQSTLPPESGWRSLPKQLFRPRLCPSGWCSHHPAPGKTLLRCPRSITYAKFPLARKVTYSQVLVLGIKAWTSLLGRCYPAYHPFIELLKIFVILILFLSIRGCTLYPIFNWR